MPFAISHKCAVLSNCIATTQKKCYTRIRRSIGKMGLWYLISIWRFVTNLQNCWNISKSCGMATSHKLKQSKMKLNSTRRTGGPSILLFILSVRRQESSRSYKLMEYLPWKSQSLPKPSDLGQLYSCIKWILNPASGQFSKIERSDDLWLIHNTQHNLMYRFAGPHNNIFPTGR